MSKWFGLPKRSAPTFPEVRIQQDGKRWTATWRLQDGRLVVDSAWGPASEPINDDTDQPTRAAEMLHGMVAARAGRPAKNPGSVPVGQFERTVGISGPREHYHVGANPHHGTRL
jgi:hypothetical protein